MEIEDIDRKIKEFKNLSDKTMLLSQRTECAAAVTELIGAFLIRRCKCVSQLDPLTKFMDGIEDDLTRYIFTMRFEHEKSWGDISILLEDRGWYSEENLRQMCYRYLKKRNMTDEKEQKETGPPSAL